MPRDLSVSSTVSYGYSTNSNFSPSDGWTSTRSASATGSGGNYSSFSASSPYVSSYNDGYGDSATISGTASGSGSDWSSYSYTETAPATGNLAWGALSGSGGASDGGGATWSYSGAGSYAQSEDGGTVSGSLSGSGSETYGEGHSASASISGGAWSQSGTGGLSASSTYQYGYSGSGSGTTATSEDYYSSPVTWTMSAESGSGSGSANAGESVEISGAGWTGTPTYSAGTRQEDSYAYSASGTGLAASGSEDQIVSTTTTGVGASPATTYGGSGQVTDNGTTLSWAPADGGAEVSGPYGYEGAGIPPIWSDPSPRPPGPEPGEFGVYGEISGLPPTTGGENSPWPVYATMDPSDVTYVFVTLTAPSLPSVAVVESLPDVPTAPSVVAQTGPTSSLQGLLTNQPPAAVEATPGTWYTAFAGYPQTSATGVTFAPQTQLAWGNDPALLPAFTSETVIGGPFGPNRAAAFPVTHSSTLVTYATAGVSAGVTAPATGSLVGAHSGARIVPTSSHAATSRRQHPRAIGANPSAANAGGLKLTPLEQHAGPNTGGSNVLQLTPELAAVPQPPGPSSPRDQLKATLREIIKKQKSLLTPQGVSDYLAGYSEGFIAGANGTLNLIKSLPSLPGQIVQSTGDGLVAVYRGVGKVGTVIGDLAGSLWNWTTPSTAIQAGRTARRVANNAVITVQNAGAILADLYAMAGELEAIVGTNLVRGLFGVAPSGTADMSALDQILDRASPLTLAILNLVASAAAELGPRQEGYIMGLVSEQIVEWAVIAAATDGAGAAIESGALASRIAKVLEGAEAFKNSAKLQAIVSALRELKVAGRTAGEIAGDLKTLMLKIHNDENGVIDLGKIVERLRDVFKAAKNSKLAAKLFVKAEMRTFKLVEGWLDAGRLAGVGKFDSLVYIIRDAKTGEILKVGETGTWETRFGEYVRRAAKEGREIEVSTFKIDSKKVLDRFAIERQIRLELKREGFKLPWDDTRIGKEYGVP